MPNSINRDMLDQLDSLQEPGEPSFAVEMILVLFKSAPASLDKMVQGLNEGNHHSVTRAAHSLKSSSANLGANRMREICLAIEHSPDLAAAKVLMPQALAEYENVKAELSAIMKEKSAKAS